MATIQVLDVATANRIAAGEVVERPASVVKELVENALDAGATAITVEAREGGIEYLRVTDNGAGFPPGEVRLAFERHATSKLRSGDPLMKIGTLGFRGEALPSIAAVSRAELTSRQSGQTSGVRLTVEGGVFGELREVGCPEGTTMVIRDLFFNTPARRKFLKKPTTEGGQVGDVVLQLALSHEEVSFRLILGGRTVFHTPGDGDLLKTIQMLYGRAIAQDLFPVDGTWGGGRLRGFVGLQDAARTNRQRESFFINGRAVRSPLLAITLEEAVRGAIAIGKYPFCVLKLDIPLEAVDVNVHPNKLEVRFRDEADVRLAVRDLIEEAVRRRDREASVPLLPDTAPLPEKQVVQLEPQAYVPPAPAPSASPAKPAASIAAEAGAARSLPLRNVESPWPEDASPAPAKEPPDQRIREVSVTKIEKKGILPNVEATEMPILAASRLVGTLFSTYVIVERAEDFLMIDQHAAHERLLYEKLRAQMGEGAISQPLLVPFFYDSTPGEKERILEREPELSALGFSLEDFGPGSIRVSSVPYILGDPQLKDFFVELIDSLDDIRVMKTADLKRDAIARIACHRAVKAGDRLSGSELTALLSMMEATNVPLTCPHGRPIVLRMTRAELERRFRRTQ